MPAEPLTLVQRWAQSVQLTTCLGCGRTAASPQCLFCGHTDDAGSTAAIGERTTTLDSVDAPLEDAK
jgi:hypothetical protein